MKRRSKIKTALGLAIGALGLVGTGLYIQSLRKENQNLHCLINKYSANLNQFSQELQELDKYSFGKRKHKRSRRSRRSRHSRRSRKRSSRRN